MGKLLQLAVFSPTPGQLRSPLCSCHRPQAVSVWLPFNSRPYAPFGIHLKSPGGSPIRWSTFIPVEFLCRPRKDATGNRLYACLGRTPFYRQTQKRYAALETVIKFYCVPHFRDVRLIYELQKIREKYDDHLLTTLSSGCLFKVDLENTRVHFRLSYVSS